MDVLGRWLLVLLLTYGLGSCVYQLYQMNLDRHFWYTY